MAHLLKMQAHIRGIAQSQKDDTAQNLRVMRDTIPSRPDSMQRNDAQGIISKATAAKTVSDVQDAELVAADLVSAAAKSKKAPPSLPESGAADLSDTQGSL
eukprot:CAMPEP_0179416022 /NCGR_PEP_ID=MMETSP0799-20121207/6567_1 /TAXON_ID=46947 /ORGANISM="Geminigera cryophila, Strain CCMP2564" /LENGTH=100 /DNA_ID=CAMNT_0021188847 /DNA_START=13 /DNA_END=315 /DNA_ORIENTATION=+